MIFCCNAKRRFINQPVDHPEFTQLRYSLQRNTAIASEQNPVYEAAYCYADAYCNFIHPTRAGTLWCSSV